MLSDIVTNIYNNLVNFITGQNAQDRFVNLLDSSPNILSDKDQADGYVGTDGNGNMFSSYYNENITRADLITALGANLAVGFKWYQVNDAVGSTKIILVQADSNISLYPIGTDLNTGEQGTYDINTDTFTPLAGSGNTNTVYLNNLAILALQTGSTLDLDTFYVVTDASPYPVMVTAEAINMIGKSARIVDDVNGGHGHYDATGNTFVGTIWDVGGNVYQGSSTGNILAAGAFSNIFNGSSSNDLTGSSFNVFTFADANILVGSNNNNFGINSTSNNLTDSTYNTFESNNQNITIDTSNQNVFKSGVSNLNPVNTNFDYCIVAGADYSVIDFTNAAQLFGRGSIWSINKVLGTDLLEVTFDANLATASTGTYDTNTDTFTPYAAGTGDVVGPASAVADNIVLFDGITGKLIKDSGVALSAKLDVAAAANYRLTASDGSGNRGNAAAITASRALKSDANGIPTHFDTATEPSLTELSYVKGVTSAIQTQINALSNTQTLTCIGLVLATVADATNYHIGTIAGTPAGTDARRAFKPTSNCTVTVASLVLEQTTNGSNETVSVYLRNVTDATETLIGTFTSDFGASTTLKTLFTGLSISLVTTKDYTIRFTTPTWGTNPANWIPSVTLQMTV